MPPLRYLSYNCRGWNSGIILYSLTLQNLVSSCDLCFIQEHWLHTDQLHKSNDLKSDFLSVAVSGIVAPCYMDVHMVVVQFYIVNHCPLVLFL